MVKNTSKQYHILNGDALKEHFPEEFEGEIIVFRECLVDGPVNASNIKDFYALRAGFISKAYGCIEPNDYYIKTVPEIEKIHLIPDNSQVNLWFEDDLFCQVNLWFILDIFSKKDVKLHLVRPDQLTRHGFSEYSEQELINLYSQRLHFYPDDKIILGIQLLWNAYSTGDFNKLLSLAEDLKSFFPFIFNAVKAHIDRQPTVNFPGRPINSLNKIITQLGTSDFGPVFSEFCKREYIYGFGDLQVKRLLDEI